MSKIFSFDFSNQVKTEHTIEVVGGQGPFSIDMISKNLNGSDSSVSFFFSNNGVDFIAIPDGEIDSNFPLPIGDDLNSQIITDVDHRFYKMVVNVGTVAVGTIDFYSKQ